MQEDILRLDIPMNDVIFVQIFNSIAYLPYPFFHFFFRHSPHLFQIGIQVFTETGLQDQIGWLLIYKKIIKFNNIRMVEIWLYFDLSNKLEKTRFVH